MIGPFHRRLHDHETFDRIALIVVPRYKTSEMSGDEWRHGVEVVFYFKGEEVHRSYYSRMEYAVGFLAAEFHKAQEPIPEKVIELERSGRCDNVGCANSARYRFYPKRLTSPNGEWLDMQEKANMVYFRQFCEEHYVRGDCSREDADENYEKRRMEETPSGTP